MAPEYEEILDLSGVKPNERCPKCGDPFLNRRSVKQDGANLYDLDEWCIVKGCGFTQSYKNVKVG
jgi:hypothetical protein